MNRRYDFRYNLMSSGPEYREKNTFCFDFRLVTDRVLNSVALNAQKEGLQLWDRDVRRFVFSDRIPDYTPIHTDLLGDPSGSRRFICIEVKGMIDNAQPVEYAQLYAQAVAALNNNERYWLTHEEEALQMQANEAFQQRPLYEDLFFQYYRPALHKEEGVKVSAGEIYLSLQKKSGVKLPMSNVSVFGRFLKKLGVMTQLVSRGRLYLVVEK